MEEEKNVDYYLMEPLLDQSSIPIGLQKTFDYMKSGVFSSSKFYEHAVGVLDCYGYVCLIGPPGSGKTLTAVQLAHRQNRKRARGTSRLYVYNNVEEIISTDYTHGAYIIVDNWLDQYMYYPSKLEVDKQRLDKIYNDLVKSKTVQIIFTAQEDRWKIFGDFLSKCALFSRQCLLTINSRTFDKNVQWKKDIIDNHLKQCSVVEENPVTRNLDKIMLNIKWEAQFSFPLIIDLICANKGLKRSLSLILMDGFTDILKLFLDKWSEEKDMDERRSFCILVFAAFLGGEVTQSNFVSRITGPIFERICFEYGCVEALEKCSSKGQELETDECPRPEKINSDEQSNILNKTTKNKEQSSTERNENIGGQTSLRETKSVEMLLNQNQRLSGCLYKVEKHGTVFVFQHNAFLRFVLQYIFKSRSERFFIENASSEVFMKNCWIERGLHEKLLAKIGHKRLASPAGLVIIPTTALKPLAERIYSKGIILSRDHVFFTNEIFKKTWDKLVEKNSSEGNC